MDLKLKEVKDAQRLAWKKIQEYSRSKRKKWNEVKRLLSRVNLGAESKNEIWLVLREKFRTGDRMVYVRLKTGTLFGNRELILSLDPRRINPEREIKSLKKLLVAQRALKTPH